MAHRTTDDDSLISSVPSGDRRSETRSSVFPSPAAQSGSTTGTASPDTRSPSPALSLRSCALHTPVSVRYPPVASAHRGGEEVCRRIGADPTLPSSQTAQCARSLDRRTEVGGGKEAERSLR